MNVLKNSSFYLKDFVSSLKGHIFYFFTALIAFFFSFIISNPIFFKMLFLKLDVISFIKEHSLLINASSIIGQLIFTGAIFLYYHSFVKNRALITNVKVFVTAVIAGNLFLFLTSLFPAAFIYILLNILNVNPEGSMLIFLFIFFNVFFYSLYVFPYFYGKALTESTGIVDTLKIFSSMKFRNYFGFLKDKRYFKITINISFLIGIIIMVLFFVPFVFIYIEMVTTDNTSVFQIIFLAYNFLLSFMYVLFSYMMIYISLKIYNEYIKKDTDKSVKLEEKDNKNE